MMIFLYRDYWGPVQKANLACQIQGVIYDHPPDNENDELT